MPKLKTKTKEQGITEIKSVLMDYKRYIDELEAEFSVDKYKLEQQSIADKNSYLPEVVEKRLADSEKKLYGTYETKIKDAREKTQSKVEYFLQTIKDSFDGYFNAPADYNFMNKLALYDSLGMKLNRYEIRSLQNSAKNYSEKRLLQAFVDKSMKKDDGFWGDVADYESFRIDIPDVEATYKQFEEFKTITLCALDYSGQELLLMPVIGVDMSDMGALAMYSNADAFFRSNCEAASKFSKWLESANEVVKADRKESLTDKEERYLNSLFGDMQSYVLERKIPESVKYNSELRELVELSPTYSKYLDA